MAPGTESHTSTSENSWGFEFFVECSTTPLVITGHYASSFVIENCKKSEEKTTACVGAQPLFRYRIILTWKITIQFDDHY